MKKTIKLFSVILALMLLLTGTQASAKTTASDAIKAYEKKISAFKKQSGYPDGIYSATVTLSQSKYPVLLVSDSAYKDNDKLVSTHASVYNYVDGKVVYIGDIASNSTSYPLCYKGKYLLYSSHHWSAKMTVNGNKGYIDYIEGFGMEPDYKNFNSQKILLKNNKQKVLSRKELTYDEAQKDYYIRGNTYAGKIINFTKTDVPKTTMQLRYNGNDITAYCNDFEITLPKHWKKADFTVKSSKNGKKRFYSFVENTNKKYGGVVFCIGVVDDKNYDFIADNLKLLGKKDGLYYYMYQATDVEFNTEDEEVAKAYTSIAKTIPKIRKSFEFR